MRQKRCCITLDCETKGLASECCVTDATLWNWAGRRDVASPWKDGARNWVGRRDVATLWKGRTKGLVRRMHHCGREVGEMLHHCGRAEQKG
jgi:hypothetical protein